MAKNTSRPESKVKLPELSSHLLDDDFQSSFRSAWTKKDAPMEHLSEKVELRHDPFTVCVVKDFIKDPKFLDKLREELFWEIFYQKNNDLYQFHQTDDLKKLKPPCVTGFRKFMIQTVRNWMHNMTGMDLTSTVSLTCSRYEKTDVLLCHDDELETRRIAFILYLSPSWTAEDGGQLDLFSMDEHFQPDRVVHSVIPQFNNLVFFEVTEASHHQVAEVLSADKTRLSLNGWFHGPAPPRPARYIEPRPPMTTGLHMPRDDFLLWINPMYLDSRTQIQIQSKFEGASEIELPTFLHEDRYDELVLALQSSELDWKLQGPPNKRRYYSLSLDQAPQIVKDCFLFMQSEALFLVLGQLTGLTLHDLVKNESSDDESDIASNSTTSTRVEGSPETPSKRPKLEAPSEPRCEGEVRKWEHGCYTLVHDTDATRSTHALAASFFCTCGLWKMEYGGYTSYISKDENDELLTVVPRENSLALVYKDTATLGFVKYINSNVKNIVDDKARQFFDFSVTYYE